MSGLDTMQGALYRMRQTYISSMSFLSAVITINSRVFLFILFNPILVVRAQIQLSDLNLMDRGGDKYV